MSVTRSPLRYPGGKAKLYEYTKKLIELNNLSGCTYVEAYAGGCGLSLELLMEGVVNKLVLNDIDISIYSFWYSVLNDGPKLAEKILNTEVTIDEWKIQKDIQKYKHIANKFELGFSTLFLNRTNRSGILSAGPIGGYEQNGNYLIDCRFNKKDLSKKVLEIYNLRNKINFYNYDAKEFINRVVSKQKRPTFVFLDPPYFNKGKELYVNFYNEDDHQELALLTKKLRKNWIVTYDNVDKIKELYQEVYIHEYDINYSVNKSYVGSEIMIYSNGIEHKPHPNK